VNENKKSVSLQDQVLLDLMERARAGDEAALGELLEAFRDQLRVQSQQDLREGIGARIDASDIVQRTCLSAVIHFQDFRGDSPQEFLAWLRQIQRRNLLDEVRKHTGTEKRDAAREVTGDDDFKASRHAAAQSTPSQAILRYEETGSLKEAIQRLPEMQAQVVRMKHFEGLRLREIAQQIGRSEQAVAGLLRRAMKQLRRELDSET